MYEVLLFIAFLASVTAVIVLIKIVLFLIKNNVIKNIGDTCYRWDFLFVYKEMTKNKQHGESAIWYYLFIISVLTGFLSILLIAIFFNPNLSTAVIP